MPLAPTALHKVVDGQAMPLSQKDVPELSALQVVPFQERIVPLAPTALHKVVDGQAMP